MVIVENKGKASAPKAGKLGIEISIASPGGKEIYVDYREMEGAVAAGFNRVYEIEIRPKRSTSRSIRAN